jgi:hypothetical protein
MQAARDGRKAIVDYLVVRGAGERGAPMRVMPLAIPLQRVHEKKWKINGMVCKCVLMRFACVRTENLSSACASFETDKNTGCALCMFCVCFVYVSCLFRVCFVLMLSLCFLYAFSMLSLCFLYAFSMLSL